MKREMRCPNCGGSVLEKNACNRYPGCPTYPQRKKENVTPAGPQTEKPIIANMQLDGEKAQS